MTEGRNKVYPAIDVLALCSLYESSLDLNWTTGTRVDVQRIRSSHSKRDGGNLVSWYTIEGRNREQIEVCFDQAELRWFLPRTPQNEQWEQWEVHIVICLYRMLPSMHVLNKVVQPLRLELVRKRSLKNKQWPALVHRLAPFRLKYAGAHGSMHIERIVTQHLENVMIDRHLHYVVKVDSGAHYHILLEKDRNTWVLVQEVDAEFFFVE